MTWIDRTNGELVLASPLGNIFYALWTGDNVSGKKRNGIFEFPKVAGGIVQPLKLGVLTYPLSFYFEGDDNDLEAIKFVNALKEDGPWAIVHPVLGELELYPATFNVNIDPVNSGNMTKFETEWIYAKLEDLVIEFSNPLSEIGLNVNATSVAKLAENVDQETPGLIAQIAKDVQEVADMVSTNLETLYTQFADVNKNIQSIKRSITTTVDQAVIDVTAIGGQLQALIQLPAQLDLEVHQRLDAYKKVLLDAYSFLPGTNTAEDKNAVEAVEIVIVSTLMAITQVITTGELKTRSEAAALIDEVSSLFSDATDNLDNVQNLFNENTIDKQYFSQTDSYAFTYQLISLANRQVLTSAFDLKIEKRFVISKPRAPIEITITEYGGLGKNDINLDTFIDSNSLKGNDILLIPAGREVVVYV